MVWTPPRIDDDLWPKQIYQLRFFSSWNNEVTDLMSRNMEKDMAEDRMDGQTALSCIDHNNNSNNNCNNNNNHNNKIAILIIPRRSQDFSGILIFTVYVQGYYLQLDALFLLFLQEQVIFRVPVENYIIFQVIYPV